MKFQIDLPQDSLKFQLQKAIAKAVNSVQGSTLYRVKPGEVHLEHPENEEFGDYASNIALAIFSDIKNQKSKIKNINQKLKNNNIKIQQFDNPTELGEEIKLQLAKQNLSFIDSIKVVNGFINISIKTDWLVSQSRRVIKEGESYGKSQVLVGKKIMVEFAHPNTHKPFHIGHLRNISTGESIVRILEAVGCKVIRANYQGDTGLHIAKCLWSIMQNSKFKNQNDKLKLKNLDEKIKFLGKSYVEGNKAYESDEKAKKEIIKINQKIYNRSGPEINKLWIDTRSWSLKYFDRIYHRVYSHFDRLYFESEVFEKGKKIVLEFLKKGVFLKSKGAIIFPGSKYGLHDRVFVNSEGNATYEGKDIGLAQLQFTEYQPDLVLHVVAPEQKGYFEVLFKALEQVFPKTKGKEYHLQYGWVRLKKGKMSSRAGKVVLGEWLLDEAKKGLIAIMKQAKKGKIEEGKKEEIDKICEKLAIGAVKYSFLKQGIDKDIYFDPKESISLEGNSGPYLQYTYARCRSVLTKASQGETSPIPPPRRSVRLLSDPPSEVFPWRGEENCLLDRQMTNYSPNSEELAILRWLYRFPEVVWETGEQFVPNLICFFLYDLASKFNAFYNKHRILNPKLEQKENSSQSFENCSQSIRAFRLLLTAACAQVLKNGLELLGIKAVEKM